MGSKTLNEKDKELKAFCDRQNTCEECVLYGTNYVGPCYCWNEERTRANYEKVFGAKKAMEVEKAKDELDKYVATTNPEIKDSGNRTTFETGAVRDMQEDKGRCDLMPLDIVAEFIRDLDKCEVMRDVADFMKTGNKVYLYNAISSFCTFRNWTSTECLLEVSMHYKQGAEKYGAYNWQKGIPLHSYIDSGVRHFLKYIDWQLDERHDRAFVWNMLGALWTIENKPEMIDIPFEVLGDKKNE